MAEGLIEQVKELLNQEDEESLKYVLCDEEPNIIQEICQKLSEKEAAVVVKVYKESRPEVEDAGFVFPNDQKEDKFKKIDEYLLEKREQRDEKKQESFLQMLLKINEKLIYEEHFGFPFYDLFKRIMTTHGDLHPLVQTVKTLHSQVQILYSTLFSEEVLKTIRERYENYDQGFRAFLEAIFSKQFSQYQNFLTVYKNIKKSTEEQQSCSEDDESEHKQIPLSQDQTLELDEKQFLVQLAEQIPIEEFNQFTKNRSYNFLCFGLKRYLLYMSISEDIVNTIKQKEFADLVSFFTIRFIRKILFEIIRQRGEGHLVNLKAPITPQQIKVVGNERVDLIVEKIKGVTAPVRNVEQEAMELFLSEFQTMNYRDFLPRRFISEANQKKTDPAEYAWQESKEYRTLWGQRVKAERYVRDNKKGPKLMLEYLNYILQNLEEFKTSSEQLWKKYIMKKFGFENEVKSTPSKRVKLGSLND